MSIDSAKKAPISDTDLSQISGGTADGPTTAAISGMGHIGNPILTGPITGYPIINPVPAAPTIGAPGEGARLIAVPSHASGLPTEDPLHPSH